MKPISSTEQGSLEFNPEIGESVLPFHASATKIGWMHSMADTDGAVFDITIKDALGRIKFKRENCTTETKRFGELINFPTLLGEELKVEISNLKGAKKLHVFLN